MTFWIICFALALLVSLTLALVLLRSRTGSRPAAAYDLQVYRDQLKEVDRDLTRGLIAEADAERVRAEVSRRILSADAQMQGETSGPVQSRALTLAIVTVLTVAAVGGSAALYLGLGEPGYRDLSLKKRIEMADVARLERPHQTEAEAQMPPSPQTDLAANYKALIEKLRATVAERPGDLQGQALLARHEAKSGNFVAAHQAQAQVIDLMGSEAGALEYGEYAELLILAAGGYVSPEAEAALRAALELDPALGPARYYWGLMLGQIGRPDLAFGLWDRTLRGGPPEAPWLVPIRGQIEEMAWRAGVEYTLPAETRSPEAPAAPPALGGPSAEDVQAAAGMSTEDRQQMIRSMVDRLSERLATEGGAPAEWARLIGALGVLGDTDRARAIFDEARQVFASDEAALAQISESARQAGLTE